MVAIISLQCMMLEMTGTHSANPARLAVAVAAPLGVLALGFGLLALGNELIYIGPLDRAQFGWLVPLPIITTVPAIAGFAWRSLSSRGVALAAAVVAVSVGVPSGVFLWINIAHPDCQFGSVLSDAESATAAVGIGILSGLSYGVATVVGAFLVRHNSPRRAAFLGVATGFVVFWIVALLPFTVAPVGLCQRPH